MPFESIIITGTSCAGKSTIAKKLCDIVTNSGVGFEQQLQPEKNARITHATSI